MMEVIMYIAGEGLKGTIIAGILRVVIAHLFRGTVSLEGFVRSSLLGGAVLSIVAIARVVML